MAQNVKSWGILKAKAEQMTELFTMRRELQETERELLKSDLLSDLRRHHELRKAHLTREITRLEQEIGL
jgi:hypothetical protein